MSGVKKSVFLYVLHLFFSGEDFLALLKKFNSCYQRQDYYAIAAKNDKCIRISHIIFSVG